MHNVDNYLFCINLASFNKISRTVYEVQAFKNDVASVMFSICTSLVHTFHPQLGYSLCSYGHLLHIGLQRRVFNRTRLSLVAVGHDATLQ